MEMSVFVGDLKNATAQGTQGRGEKNLGKNRVHLKTEEKTSAKTRKKNGNGVRQRFNVKKNFP